MKITLNKRDDDFYFEAVGSSNIIVKLDASTEIGGKNKGARPMELLLMGLAGCTAIDIVLILKKQRILIHDFEITVDGERKLGTPSPFEKIHIHYKVTANISEEQFNKVVELSMINEAEKRMKKTLDAASQSLANIRTGKASPSLIESIKVDVYGQLVPLKQAGTISSKDSQTLVVQVWDKALVSTIEKAIRDANMGLNPASDGQLIRVGIPPLTEDRRKEYVKLVKKYAEEARVSLRNIRRDSVQSLEKSHKDKLITEDELRKGKKDADHLIQKMEKQIEDMTTKKETEIMEI
ncbi:hypothetical protein CHS0354_024058 [Potamilus streckersoni]|uniref:Ribosome-recycling factor, mitochondrial n=1 Tax=Potamilus streckersoni TaxID=2493646 RepID=A0AAE0VMU9_9BIVA|nr:hypothetical protein CHS0354_024058 [Potamilus streckersoni]